MSVTPIGDVAEFRADLIRSGRRGTLIGAAAGVGAVVVFGVLIVGLSLALGAPDGLDAGETLRLVLQAVVIVAVTAVLGRLIATAPSGHRLRDLAGGRTEARRIGRILFKGAVPSDEHEAGRARGYAPYLAVALRVQGPTLAAFYLVLLLNVVLQLFNGAAGPDWLRALQLAVIAGLVVLAAFAIPLQIRRVHQAEAYGRPT